jgi:transposase
MFWVPSSLKFYLYRHPTDMRKSFDGLSGIINNNLKEDPLSGGVYIFLNKRKTLIKLLLWDGDGFWIFYKRLEKGTFQIPDSSVHADSIELAYDQLMMIIKGIDLNSVKRRLRYRRSA